jgi:chromate reductase
MSKKIAVIVGSLRKDSLNRKLAKALTQMAPKSIDLQITEIEALPMYNADLDDEGRAPAAWTTFRQQIKSTDGILFITPEYNRSMPGVLKNAIDVGSRPYGENVWNAKPSAIISLSPGAIGGFGANHHLRQSLTCLNSFAMPAPETYIGQAGTLFNEQGELIQESVAKFMQQVMETFSKWVYQHCE